MTRNQITVAVLIFLFALSLVFMAPAFAQTPCGPRGELVKYFKDKYNETRTDIAIAGEVNLVEVFASPGGATWTFLVTSPDGRSCIVAAGKDWFSQPAEIEGKDS